MNNSQIYSIHQAYQVSLLHPMMQSARKLNCYMPLCYAITAGTLEHFQRKKSNVTSNGLQRGISLVLRSSTKLAMC